MSLSVAIVGAGPSGFYCAEAILRKLPDARIDLLDRLPTPYGLVRAGVAPDHQGTKAVSRVFERIAGKGEVRFLGNVMVGRDVGIGELCQDYDAVVVAAGACLDRQLGLPGEALRQVIGSFAFVGWYNSHPDYADLDLDLSQVRSVVVIGNGNVAIDVVRVLAKTPEEMAKSDIAPRAGAAIAAAPLREIHLLGRRGPLQASFTNAELAELGRLQRAAPHLDAADLPAQLEAPDGADAKLLAANLATFRSFASAPSDRPLAINFHFHTVPLAFLGAERVQAVRCRRHEREFDLPADLVITCIGYRMAGMDELPLDPGKGIARNDEGRIAPGLYAVGWAKRGPSGVIATNRADSIAVAERLLAEVGRDPAKPGPAGLDRRLRDRGVRVISFADWKIIDAAEVAAGAASGRPRVKMARAEELLAALGAAAGKREQA